MTNKPVVNTELDTLLNLSYKRVHKMDCSFIEPLNQALSLQGLSIDQTTRLAEMSVRIRQEYERQAYNRLDILEQLAYEEAVKGLNINILNRKVNQIGEFYKTHFSQSAEHIHVLFLGRINGLYDIFKVKLFKDLLLDS